VRRCLALEITFRRSGCPKVLGEKIKVRTQAKIKINQSGTRRQKSAAQAEYTGADKHMKKSVRRDKRQWIDEHAQRAEEAEKRGCKRTKLHYKEIIKEGF
jgi:hypothetical protein